MEDDKWENDLERCDETFAKETFEDENIAESLAEKAEADVFSESLSGTGDEIFKEIYTEELAEDGVVLEDGSEELPETVSELPGTSKGLETPIGSEESEAFDWSENVEDGSEDVLAEQDDKETIGRVAAPAGRKKKPQTQSVIKLASRFNGIMYKIIGGYIVPIILIMILGVLSYKTASKAIVENFETSARSTIEKTAEYYSLLFSNIKSMANDLANNNTVKEYYSGSYDGDNTTQANAYNEIRATVSSLATSNTMLKNVFLIGKSGKDLYANGSAMTGNEYETFKTSDEAKLVDEQRALWMSDHEYLDKYGAQGYKVSYARQIMGTNKRSVGYMFFDIAEEDITAPLSGVNIGDQFLLTLVAPDGGETVISTSEEIDASKKYFADKECYQAALAGEEKSGASYQTMEGKQQLFIYAKTDDNFMVCAAVPKAVIVAQADTIRIITITTVIIAVIGAAVIGSLMAKNMRDAINKIMSKVSKAANGDLTVVVRVNRKDEFKTLADGINNMISKMKQLIAETKNVSGKVDESAEVVSNSSKTLLEATRNISDVIHDIEQGIVAQAEDSESCMEQMDVLSDKINQVSENSEKIASIAGDTQKIVQSGLDMIDILNSNAKDTVYITTEVIEGIQTLETSTNSIETIINVINEIADQTNLLSLNASIEAARAGEAGRGFAVVADEIRKLADQSVASVNQIRDIVEEINGKTRDTVTIAKRAEDVVAVQEKSLKNTVAVFQEIQTQVNSLVGNLGHITSGVDDIAAMKAETISSIQNISAVSQQTAASTEEVNTTADKQTKAVEELNRAAEILSENSDELDKAINLFVVE